MVRITWHHFFLRHRPSHNHSPARGGSWGCRSAGGGCGGAQSPCAPWERRRCSALPAGRPWQQGRPCRRSAGCGSGPVHAPGDGWSGWQSPSGPAPLSDGRSSLWRSCMEGGVWLNGSWVCFCLGCSFCWFQSLNGVSGQCSCYVIQ